jgi:hypothetical protein
MCSAHWSLLHSPVSHIKPSHNCVCESVCNFEYIDFHYAFTNIQNTAEHHTPFLSVDLSSHRNPEGTHVRQRHSDCAFFTCVPRAPPPHRPAPQPPLATRLHWPPPRLYASFSEGGSGVACWPLAARLALLRSRLRCAALMRTKSESQYSCSATKLTWLELGRG